MQSMIRNREQSLRKLADLQVRPIQPVAPRPEHDQTSQRCKSPLFSPKHGTNLLLFRLKSLSHCRCTVFYFVFMIHKLQTLKPSSCLNSLFSAFDMYTMSCSLFLFSFSITSHIKVCVCVIFSAGVDFNVLNSKFSFDLLPGKRAARKNNSQRKVCVFSVCAAINLASQHKIFYVLSCQSALVVFSHLI